MICLFLFLKERIRKLENHLEEHRELLTKANEQIELNNQEMQRIKEEASRNLGGSFDDDSDPIDDRDEDERQMREIVEQFEVEITTTKINQ